MRAPLGHFAADLARDAGVSWRHDLPAAVDGRDRSGLSGQRQRDHAVAAPGRACRCAAALRPRCRRDRRRSISIRSSDRCRVIHAIDKGALITARTSRACRARTCRRACWFAPARRRPPNGRRRSPRSRRRRSPGWPSLGVRLVGIDSQSVDPADSKTLDSHQQLLAHDMRVLENLVLDDVRGGRLRADRAAAQADPRVRIAGARRAAIARMITRDSLRGSRCHAIRSRRCERCLRWSGSTAQGVIYLDGNSLGVLPDGHAGADCGGGRSRVGRRPDPQLEHRGLDHAVAADRRQDRAADRRRPGRSDGRRFDVDQSLQGAECRDRALRQRRRLGDRLARKSSPNAPTFRPISTSPTPSRASTACELVLVDQPEIAAHLDDRVAILMLTHVNYRTGFMHDMADADARAHDAGALVIWDLAHSAGAVPVESAMARRRGGGLRGRMRLQVPERRSRRAGVCLGPPETHRVDGSRRAGASRCQDGSVTPRRSPFRPSTNRPTGIARFVCGTPPVLSLAALECGVDTVLAAEDAGGIEAIREKSLALTDLFIDARRSSGAPVTVSRWRRRATPPSAAARCRSRTRRTATRSCRR